MSMARHKLQDAFGNEAPHTSGEALQAAPRTSSRCCAIYLFRSPAGAAGFGCMVERAVAGGVTFSLFRFGFFGSRPLRF
jgi:hypothetical protein